MTNQAHRRYVTAPRALVFETDDDRQYTVTASEVIVEDDTPRPTGLVDAGGCPIYSVRDRIAVGFRGSKDM